MPWTQAERKTVNPNRSFDKSSSEFSIGNSQKSNQVLFL
jgi:hypothetical protein